ncbi:MAG: LysR family transcriptional regulator [Clostridium sp.]|nr:LysR family transcriptional regulator [Clostridium sp.]
MAESLFLKADDVAYMLGISKAHAYKIMQQLNDELAQKGYITISGRVSKQYFNEKVYGTNAQITKQKGA